MVFSSLSPILFQLLAIAASLIGLTFIIVFHEFGHYLFCKLFNVYTPTFSIGIGKVLVSKKIGDTNFCISAGPIGGYVEVASEQGINGSLGFNQVPYYQKVLIMLGGIACNFILAYVIFVGLFWTGMPENAVGTYDPCTTIIKTVESTSANAHILAQGDELVSIGHQPLNSVLTPARKIIAQTSKHTTTIPAQISRNGQVLDVTLNLAGAKTHPAINKQLDVLFVAKPALSFCQSLYQAYADIIFYTKAIIAGLKNMVEQKTTDGFVGPLRAVAASSKSAQKGLSNLLFFLAIISINLGFINFLPLPIFDGGQFVIFTIEAIIRRQLSERVRHWIGISSWVLAIGLLILFTIRDAHALFFQ